MYTCEYCNNTFSTNNILQKHQYNARYCLAIQGKDTKRVHRCEYCSKTFSRSDSLKRHLRNCEKHKLIQEVKNHDNNDDNVTDKMLEMIVDLQKTVRDMASASGNTDGMTINNSRNNVNLTPITDEEIKEHLKNLTLDFIFDGAKGYAVYANFYPLKGRVICTDKSRNKLRYKDGDIGGEVINDFGGVKLAQRFFQAIAPRNEELINAEYRNLQQQVQHIADTGTAGTSDLTGILTKSTKLQDLLVSCRQAARGEENNLTRGFIKHFARLL